MNLRAGAHKRAGISEMIGVVLAIAVTLIAGGAVFGWVNAQTAVNERQYGQSAGASYNQLAERFVIVNANFSSSNTKVTLWVYNFGTVALSPIQVFVYNNSRTMSGSYNPTASPPTSVSCSPGSGCTSASSSTLLTSPLLHNTNTGTGLSIPVGTVQPITITLPGTITFNTGRAYGFSVVGLYGNTVTYYQTR